MEIIPVLTKHQLIDANNWAIKRGYNRALQPEPLQEYLDAIADETKFPIVFSTPHEHAAGKAVEEHMRCRIVFDGQGSAALLDMDLDFYNSLGRIEYDPDNTGEEEAEVPNKRPH